MGPADLDRKRMHEHGHLDHVGGLTMDVRPFRLAVVGDSLIDMSSRSRKKTDTCSSIAGGSEATHRRCWAFRTHGGSQASLPCFVGRYESPLDEIVVVRVGRC